MLGILVALILIVCLSSAGGGEGGLCSLIPGAQHRMDFAPLQ